MDKDFFLSLVDDLAAFDTRTLTPFFRVPPLYSIPNCLELLAYAKFNALIVQLDTNVLLLTKEISHALVAMGVNFISFSVDANNLKTYKERRKEGSFARILKGKGIIFAKHE